MAKARKKTEQVSAPQEQSVGYPEIPLRIAIDECAKIYKIVAAKPFNIGDAGEWITKTLSSMKSSTAALRKYGLVAGFNQAMRLTDRALDIVAGTANESVRQSALRAAALEPDIVKKVHAKFSAGLPGRDLIANFLRRDLGFGPNRATKAAGIILLNSQYASIAPTIAPTEEPAPMERTDSPPEEAASSDLDLFMKGQLALPDSGRYEIHTSRPITKKDIRKIIKALEVELSEYED